MLFSNVEAKSLTMFKVKNYLPELIRGTKPRTIDEILIIIKQWPLAGEFVEFEYSPKIRQFWRI